MKIDEESLVNLIRDAKDLLSLMELVQGFKNLGAADEDYGIDDAYLDLSEGIKEFKSTTYKLNNTGEYSLSQMKIMKII